MKRLTKLILTLAILAGAMTFATLAQDAAPAAKPDPITTLTDNSSSLRIGIDTVWVLVTAMLVFFMNLGFAADASCVN